MSRTWTMPRTWNRRKIIRPEALRKNNRNHWRTLAERRQLAGLTTRGTVPKRRLEARLVLAEIDALAATIARRFEIMPPEIQAICIELSSQLAAVRKRII